MCREGSFNLQANNSLGCSECFCSGATSSCHTGRWFREEIPINIFSDTFAVAYRDGNPLNVDTIDRDFDKNRMSYATGGEDGIFWSLPSKFTGNQILSYGGNLIFNLETEGSGEYVRDHDVIMRGNDITLVWQRPHDGDWVNNLVFMRPRASV